MQHLRRLKCSVTNYCVFLKPVLDGCSFILTCRDYLFCPMQTVEGHYEQVMAYIMLVEVQVDEP